MYVRLFFALCLLLLVAVPSSLAQTLSYSLKAGFSATNISGEVDNDFEARTALSGGFGLGYDFGNGFMIQPEILYLVKGAYTDTEINTTIINPDGSSDSFDTPVRARFDLTYIEFPVLASYTLGQGRLQPRVFAGPTVGYNVNASVNVRARDSDTYAQSYSDSSVKTWDYGAVMGIGTDIVVSEERLRVDARFLLGRANVRSVDPPLQNVGFSLLFGIAF